MQWTQRQHLLSWPMSQVAGENAQVVIRTKTRSAIMTCESGGRQKYPNGYPYKDSICYHDLGVRWQAKIPKWSSVQRQHLLSWPMCQVAGGNTQVVIRTKTTSVIMTCELGDRRKYPSGYPYKDNICYHDLWLRWQAKIPKWLPVQRQHLLSWPVRSQVESRDTQGLSAHTHIYATPTCEKLGSIRRCPIR